MVPTIFLQQAGAGTQAVLTPDHAHDTEACYAQIAQRDPMLWALIGLKRHSSRSAGCMPSEDMTGSSHALAGLVSRIAYWCHLVVT